jgi:hypothetical protein
MGAHPETLDSYLNVAVETAKTAGQVLKLTLAHCRISEFPVWLVGCLPSLLAWPISLLNSVTLSYSLSTGVLICSEFDPAVCPFFLLIFFQIILSNFNNSKTVEHKGKVDLVTETDKACESLIFEYLKTAFPSHQLIGEETSAIDGTPELTDAPTWIVDPLDGTTNFVHRYPFVCVSIGLVVDKVPTVGVVFNPILDELFTAVKGRGAFLNGQHIYGQ